jgi:hypothetical protein
MAEILPRVRGEWESFVRGRGSELYRIREYMPEDSARHVDWKATAKSGSLKVREFAREDERKLCIAFDNPEPALLSERAYERAVDLTASLAWHFSTQEAEISYLVRGRPRTRDLHEFLAWLSVVEPGTIEPGPIETGSSEGSLIAPASSGSGVTKTDKRKRGTNRVLQNLPATDPLREMSLGSDEYHIIITARPRECFPPALSSSAYLFPIGDEPIPRNGR